MDLTFWTSADRRRGLRDGEPAALIVARPFIWAETPGAAEGNRTPTVSLEGALIFTAGCAWQGWIS